MKLKDLQSILQRNEIVVEYVLGQERSFALEIGPRVVNSYTLPPRRYIESAVERYVKTAKDLGDVAQTARELYRLLLEPIAGVQSAQRVVIVPDGALHILPFDALIDRSGALVVTRSVISYAPSASVNYLLLRSDRGKRSTLGKELLAVGGVNCLNYGARGMFSPPCGARLAIPQFHRIRPPTYRLFTWIYRIYRERT